MAPPRLQCSDIRFAWRGPDVLRGIDLEVAPGELVGLIGPNGSGKSTLLRVAARLETPRTGEVRLDGQPMAGQKRRALARRVAFLPQDFELAFPFTVLEVVLTGRHPYLSWIALEGRRDLEIARQAMAAMGIDGLADRRFHELSGGERLRTMIAASLAQEPSLLLFDEPTANLDLRYQDEVLRVVASRVRESGNSAVLAIHDLNLALAWCPRLVMLSEGRIVADGTPEEVLTPKRLHEVYGAGAEVIRQGGRTAVLPAGPAGEAVDAG